ncbi:hypothetical protein GCM10009801_81930 [Streptomyces albiaxialis]|uniref:DUF2637 domain-containing protein n=1 Tax=Streptomyces albiaxialis TaxID=329523 RepID=A0ABN2X5W0_9ACTN
MIEQVEAILPPWSLVAAVASGAVTATAAAVLIRRRSRTTANGDQGQEGATGRRRRRLSAGTAAAAVAFVVCTSVSLNTSYRFTLDGLGMTGIEERVLACAAFEALIAMCVLGARERLASEDATPGWYGTAVWVFAALSAVPAWHEGGGLTPATLVRIIVGSFGSALSAHAALGLELKHRTGGQSQSPGALIVRELRERLMARLGLIQRGRNAEQITRDRYMDRAIEHADEYDRLTPEKRKARAGRKLCGRMAQAMDRAGCAEPERRMIFDRRLAMRRDVARLPDVDLPSTWTAQPTPEERAALAQLQRQTERMEALAAQIEDQAEHHPAHSAPEVTPPVTAPAQQRPTEDAEEEQQDIPEGARTAAYGTGTPRITVRVPDLGDEHQDQDDEPEALDLKTFPTKVGALRALFERHQVAADDPRSHNQIATALLAEMLEQGIEYDRGAACRAIAEWRAPRPVTAQQAHANTLDRELTHI